MPNRLLVGPALAAVLLLLPVPPLQAQNATLTGVVTVRETGQPLPNVSVFLEGTGYGTITGPNGRYTISNVAPGTYNVVAQTLGYADARRANVVLERGATLTVDFTLQMQVLSMQEVVVTGVADPTEGVRVPFTVSRVSREDISVPATNMMQTLQGRVAGIRTMPRSGEPGTGFSVRIRGRLSVNTGIPPLVVVDGVVQGSNALDMHGMGSARGGSQGADILDLDPNDIESIEIVKGAAASSLYGSRAQNGVIQITTRRGRDVGMNTTVFGLRSEYGYSMLGKMPEIAVHHPYLQNEAGQWLDRDGNVVDRAQRATQPSRMVDQPYRNQTYDNIRGVFDPGNTMNTTFTMARNTQDTNFFISVGDFRERGLLPEFNEGYQRQNFRVNLEQRLRDNLTLAVTSYYSRSEKDNVASPLGRMDYLAGNIFWNLRFIPPDYNVREKDEDGDYKVFTDIPMSGSNPLYSASAVDSRDSRGRIQGSAVVRYNPVNWLNFEGVVAFDRSDRSFHTFYPKGFKTVLPSEVNQGHYSRLYVYDHVFNASLQTALLRTFGDLTTRLRLRYNLERDSYTSQYSAAENFRVKGIRSLSNAYIMWGESAQQPVRSESVLAALGLDYGGRYIMDALVRTDGSSLFGPDSRWNTYSRIALAWRMAEEDWWPFPDFLTEFKPRISRGTAGARPDFAWRYETWNVGVTGTTKGQLGNRLLRPEVATETEYGLDFIMKDRFSVGLVYADTEVRDQLVPVPLAGVFGYTAQWLNAGIVRSTAYEATIEALLVSRPDLSWRSGLVFDRSRSTLHDWTTQCYREGFRYRCAGVDFGDMVGRRFLTTKEQINEYWGGRFAPYADQFQINDDGYLVAVGNAAWRDGLSKGLWGTSVNIDGVDFRWGHPILQRNERGGVEALLNMGNTDPKVNFGWTNNIRWRGVQLYALFYGSLGWDLYNETRQAPYRHFLSPDQVQVGKPDDRKKPLDYYETLYDGYSWNSAFVEDGSFLKLGQVSVGYRFSQSQLARAPIMSGLGMSSLTLELIGRNLFTLTNFSGIDPEVGSLEFPNDSFGYPRFRTITFGVDIVF